MNYFESKYIKEAYDEHFQILIEKSLNGNAAKWVTKPETNINPKESMNTSKEMAEDIFMIENPESYINKINGNKIYEDSQVNGYIHLMFMFLFRKNKEEMYKTGIDKFDYNKENIRKTFNIWIKNENGKVKVQFDDKYFITSNSKYDSNFFVEDNILYIFDFELLDFWEHLINKLLTNKIINTKGINYRIKDNKLSILFNGRTSDCEISKNKYNIFPKEFGDIDYFNKIPRKSSIMKSSSTFFNE